MNKRDDKPAVEFLQALDIQTDSSEFDLTQSLDDSGDEQSADACQLDNDMTETRALVNLTMDDKRIADENAEIELIKVSNVYAPNGNLRRIYTVSFKVLSDSGELEHSESIDYDQQELLTDNGRLKVADSFPFIRRLTKRVSNHLKDELLRLGNTLKPVDCCLYDPGFNLVGDRLVYFAFDKLITADEILDISSNSNYRLADFEISDKCKEVAKKIFTEGSELRAYFIGAFVPFALYLVQPFQRQRFDPVFYLLSKGESFKSEIDKIMTAMYVYKDDTERPANALDLESDSFAVECAAEFKHCSLLLDGNRVTGSREIDKRIQKNVRTVVNRKRGVNNTLIDGKNVHIGASVSITGNMIFDKEHLITRCVLIKLDQTCRAKLLTWLQNNIEYFVGLKVLFIQYIIRNYDSLKEKMSTMLRLRHLKSGKIHSPSLRDSKAILYATAEIFLDFLKEISYPKLVRSRTSSYGNDCERSHTEKCSLDYGSWGGNGGYENDVESRHEELEIFKEGFAITVFDPIDKCIKDTAEALDGNKNAGKQEVIDDFLRSLISYKSRFITKDLQTYTDEYFSCGGRIPEHFVYNDEKKKRFYVRSEHLELLFSEKCKCKFSKHEILDHFDIDGCEEHNLIKKESGAPTVHLELPDKGKMRFICIKEKPLKRYLRTLE